MHVLTGVSLCTILMFNIERILVIKYTIYHSIIKLWRGRFLIMLYIIILFISGICFIIYSEKSYCNVTYTPDQIQQIFIRVYEGLMSIYLIIGIVLLPILSCILTLLIYHIQKNHNILQQSWRSNPVSIEVKITKQLIIMSIYTAICLFPFSVWILRGTSRCI